jgi:predicted nucleic acid-binding protein
VQYLVDTNILLRIADLTSAQHRLAADAVAELVSRNDELFVAPQVVSEFWVVASRPTTVNGLGWSVDAVELEIVKILDQYAVLPETPQLFFEWHRLVLRHRIIGKQAHDARLVAIMNNSGLTHLLTFNVNNFRAYDLTVLSPDEILTT